MKAPFLSFSLVAAFTLMAVSAARGRAQSPQPDDQVRSAPPSSMQGGPEGQRRGIEARGPGVFGKISALEADSMEITGHDGTKVSIKLTSSTEFRKDRQPAKISDFKVGDTVVVRTNQDSSGASGATALLVAAAPAGGFGGRGSGGGQGMMQGTLGKDYVVGEVKSIDAPKLTILRVDSVMQTLELNEETSLRRGRDSVTMADIQPGDHIFARGAVANDVFVPKSVMVIPPEQWNRMRELMNDGGEKRGATPQNAPAPLAPSAAPTPPEQRN
jgi:hypothetical protein